MGLDLFPTYYFSFENFYFINNCVLILKFLILNF